MLKKLCRLHTDLTEEDILQLENIEKSIYMFSNLVKGDIFIDCLTRDPDTAIVVSEAKPTNCKSLYKRCVVGEIALRQNEPAALRTLEIGVETTDLKATTQENIVVKQNTVPIKNKNEKIIGVLIMEKDITEDISQSRNVEILSETTEQLSETLMNIKDPDYENAVAYNLINDAILAINEVGICIYSNYKAEELYKKLGYKDKIVGMSFDNIVLNEIKFKDIIKEKKSIVVESNVGKLVLQIKYAVTKKSEDIYGIIILIKDLTDIKQKEKELILKAVAIREIHHRVKNNLQTIASILRLQSRRIDNVQAKKAFEESINRILSIATTHEVLSQKGIDDADIKTILSKIKDNAMRNSVQCNKKIKIELRGDNLKVNSDKATSIAIVVNELIENSLKHAFNDKAQGIIEITINKGQTCSNISISDDGSGFDVNLLKNESLGLNIVKSIIKDKLDGNINIKSNDNGTKSVFYFNN
ncbi:Two-component sensor histidine kinase, contains HisKA and HATPase domains [Clostridium acidisoli DSM 12555]|uniref:histidine kinase n=1 Tax=Clostridium acidisoli DSM 12555 TaxID=1121291 RepID=A0A1W1XFD7_9CLOT|nr:sensor histidine kinase [Clostridium acidisoli]SMC22532.1 Two-component sensor histidine kinase, contains HisKA and HATPase domains [Clostridium acidisoli DSM 12555]